MRSAVACLPLLLVLLGAAPQPKQVSPHEKAARELFEISGGDVLVRKGTQRTWEQLRKIWDIAEDDEVFRAWHRKYFDTASLEAEIVDLYMRRFSEKEIREIVAFYKTPAGRKMAASMPDLLEEASAIAERKAEEHYPDLQEMIAEAAAERESRSPANDKEAQKRTIRDIRNTGTAMFSWLTDQVGAAAAGQSQIDVDDYPVITSEELREILLPQYIQAIPEADGWGNPFDYFLNVKEPLAKQVMAIRSPGRDGRYSSDSYSVTSFDPKELDEDIVWADGFFVRWPQSK